MPSHHGYHSLEGQDQADVEAHLLDCRVASERNSATLEVDREEAGSPYSQWGRPHLLFLGSLLLFAMALIPRIPGFPRHSVQTGHTTDLWDEAIIQSQHKTQEKSSCGHYGCGQSRLKLGTCGCDDSCMADGSCCYDYQQLCKVSSAESSKEGNAGRCATYGCPKAYRYNHSCQCVPSCKDFGDCCPDYTSHCGANQSPASERAPNKNEEPKVKAAFVPQAYVSAGSKKKHKVFEKEREASIQLMRWQAVRSCPPQFLDKTILAGKQIAKLSQISTAAECQKACTDHGTGCDGFVWEMSGTCVLSDLKNDLPMMVIQEGLIAGMPCCRPGVKHNASQVRDCPENALDTEVTTNAGLRDVPNVKSAYKCQEVCTETAACGAFSWDPGAHRCSLKQLAPTETAKVMAKAGFVSGLPCGCRATPENALWPASDVERFTMPLPRGQTTAKPGSLLCLALMVPYSYEAGLLVMQYRQHVGIFSCDEYQVYSSQAMVLAPGLETRKVLTSQKCEVGGEFKSALNLRIFASFWRQVVIDGQYLLYNWIVKADPDSVFFPQRLRPILKQHEAGSMSQSSPGIYFNNCKFGMHGPLEVFSVATVRALSSSFVGCYDFFQKLCNGDCQWGEDMWVDQCLKRSVQAKRVFNSDLLSEAHCDPSPGWQECKDPIRVAFHPFKTVTDHRICQQSAEMAAIAA